MVTLPNYERKADLLSDIQTLALAGCGNCPRDDPKGGPPRLCKSCDALLTKMLIRAAWWKPPAQ